MKAFLTGSRAYGFPNLGSDIDLVALVDDVDLAKLCDVADKISDFGSPGGTHYEDGCALRFGILNLICVTDTNHFETWKQGTDELKAKAPVERDVAVEHLKKLRQEKKIHGW